MDDILADVFANPLVSSAGTVLAGVAVALWVAAAWWAYRDAGRRAESLLAAYLAAAWIVVATPLFLPFALVIYRVLRPQVPAAEQRATALARELGEATAGNPACTGCGMAVDAAWLRCPDCATWLAAPCTACARWSDPGFDICPWCGAERQHAPEQQPVPERLPVPVAAAVAVTNLAGHGTAAADGMSAAAGLPVLQRRAISSARPLSYAASRDTSSASS